VVAFVSRNIKSKAEIAAPSAPGPSQRLALFGPPLLIEGEDALYDQLVDHFCAVIKPVDIIDLVDKLVTEAGESIEVFMAQALAKKLGKTERIDRQITIAEGRRNASLREIDRRRAVLGQALRRAVQEIEDHQFEMIETTPAEGGNAA
jgi:hypothetical protein